MNNKSVITISDILIKYNKLVLFFAYMLTAIITLVVYLTGGTFRVYPNLMYIPIAIVSSTCTKKAGLLHALLSGLAMGPFMLLNIELGLEQTPFNWLMRIALYLTISITVAFFSTVALKEYKVIIDKNEEVLSAQELTILSLAKITEARDADTGKHIERIVLSTKLLLTKLFETGNYNHMLDQISIEYISKASSLHDIGKVAIADKILLKPGKLTFEEFEIMKTHTTIGANTLKDVYELHPDNRFINIGIDIIMHHHEKWDGTGYPSGLKEEEIPFSARVVSIVDVYDALRSKRLYKTAFSHEKSIDIIKSSRNIQFDGQILDVFLSNEFDFNQLFNENSM